MHCPKLADMTEKIIIWERKMKHVFYAFFLFFSFGTWAGSHWFYQTILDVDFTDAQLQSKCSVVASNTLYKYKQQGGSYSASARCMGFERKTIGEESIALFAIKLEDHEGDQAHWRPHRSYISWVFEISVMPPNGDYGLFATLADCEKARMFQSNLFVQQTGHKLLTSSCIPAEDFTAFGTENFALELTSFYRPKVHLQYWNLGIYAKRKPKEFVDQAKSLLKKLGTTIAFIDPENAMLFFYDDKSHLLNTRRISTHEGTKSEAICEGQRQELNRAFKNIGEGNFSLFCHTEKYQDDHVITDLFSMTSRDTWYELYEPYDGVPQNGYISLSACQSDKKGVLAKIAEYKTVYGGVCSKEGSSLSIGKYKLRVLTDSYL